MRDSYIVFRFSTFLLLVFFCGPMLRIAAAQTPGQSTASSVAATAQQGISLTEKGRCTDALPLLKKTTTRLADKQLQYHAAMAMVRCAMSLEQQETALQGLMLLQREFPRDPEVLYVSTHYYSELASRASQQLLAVAPTSVQVHELDAEGYESHGQWDEATAEYKKILEQNPKQPGIHYRLGRIALSKPSSPAITEEAKKEFEAELQLDPSNASAEFMLGELARQAGQWDAAIQHFSRSAKLDSGFLEAFLALGVSYNAAGRYSDAVAPLENYVKKLPADPAGHYQLALAYARTGNKEGASRESALQRETAEQAQHGPQAGQDPSASH